MTSSNVPFVHRRVPTWGDTDSAQIVYTVRFVDYAMDAIDLWFREVMQLDWYRMNTEMDMGTPFVKIDMDIKSPLTPEDQLEVRVLVENMGRSSLTFDVQGRRNGADISFESRFICSMVRKSTMRSIEIPAHLRRNVEAYMSACAAAPDGGGSRRVGTSK